MDQSVLHRVRDLVANTIGETATSLDATTTPADVEQWDSFAQLNIMVALEDEFSIQLAPEDADQMVSIGAIVELVQARLG